MTSSPLAGSRFHRRSSCPANFVANFQARSITSRLDEMIANYLGVSGPVQHFFTGNDIVRVTLVLCKAFVDRCPMPFSQRHVGRTFDEALPDQLD